jgi:vanillin dehydrogenase
MAIIERGLIIGSSEGPAEGGRMVDDISPWSGRPFARVAAASVQDVERAITAAAEAFDRWAAMGAYERRRILLRAAELIEARADEATRIMAGEVGGAAPWAQFNVALCAEVLREAAAAVTHARGELLATNIPKAHSLAVRVPHGVIAAIAPWNAPYILGIRSIAVPLAMGNTVVLKPSEDAPIACGLFLADVLRDAGLPPGVLNVITNDLKDAGDIVAALIADPRVRLVNFTGSTKVGRIIGVTAAQHLKPAVLELGGKNALIVLKDADLDHAVKAALFGGYFNAGQICMSTDRIIVVKAVAEAFATRLAERVKSLAYGDPSDPKTFVGPMVNPRGAAHAAALVEDAVAKGARLLAGTGSVEGDGKALMAPVLLSDVTKAMDIYYGEIFGPISVLHIVDDLDAAVELANDSEYGLTGGVISQNLSEAMDVASRVRTGIFHINDQGTADEPMAPFGGVKNSGYGRFGGAAGIENFSTMRWITLQPSGVAQYGL